MVFFMEKVFASGLGYGPWDMPFYMCYDNFPISRGASIECWFFSHFCQPRYCTT